MEGNDQNDNAGNGMSENHAAIDRQLLEGIIEQKDIIIKQQDSQLTELRKTVISQNRTIEALRARLGLLPDSQDETTDSSSKRKAISSTVLSEMTQKKKIRYTKNYFLEDWDEHYAKLATFRAENPFTNPKEKDGHTLCNFYETMRRYYRKHKKGETNQLTLEQVAKLEAVGFSVTEASQLWEVRFEELKAYHNTHGHFNVSRHDNYQLWGWIKTQRSGYRRYQIAQKDPVTGSNQPKGITPEHMAKLQAIGFPWSVQVDTYETSWENRFEQLKEYKAQHGDCNVPRTYPPNPQLGQWMKDQRKKYWEIQRGLPRRGLLTEERIERLNQLGVEWKKRPRPTNTSSKQEALDWAAQGAKAAGQHDQWYAGQESSSTHSV